MKAKGTAVAIIFSCILLILFISGCGHTHEWKEANCVTPKTCSICNETEGDALGHDWVDASCTSAKKCSRCGVTEGDALGHDWQVKEVVEPTCKNQGYTTYVCTRCNGTEKRDKQAALGHDWLDATCTEAKTCTRCGQTLGSPLGHDTSSVSCTEAGTCSRCGEEIPALGHDWKEATCTEPKTCTRCGETEGEALGHKVTGGVCARCGLDPFIGGKTTFKDLHAGEIGKIEDIYVGLQYVKTMDYLPTEFGNKSVPNDHEIVFGFFEFYNSTNNLLSINPHNVKCYADGILMSGVENYTKVIVDGVSQYYDEDIDGGYKLLSVQDFEVPKGWSEIKFFYNSECVWTITPKDASSKEYQAMTLFQNEYDYALTQVDDVIYSDEYEVRYLGAELYEYNKLGHLTENIVFKFRITNISESAIDLGYISSAMRAYQNMFYIDSYSLYVDGTIDNCIKMSKIDVIEPGMSTNTYLAFEIIEPKGLFVLAFDDGGLFNHHLCGYVYANLS